MKRRDFLMMGAVAATSVTAVRRGWAQARNDDKLSRIAIMMFGLNSIVKTNMPAGPERTLELMDIGQFSADHFKVHNVELQSNYFPSTEMSWLKDFKSRLDKTNTKVVQINLEFGAGYNMGAESPSGRLQMIDLHRSWLDKAAFLGSPRVLLNQGQPTQENKAQIIANYQAVVALAKAKGITPASENRNAGGGRGAGGRPRRRSPARRHPRRRPFRRRLRPPAAPSYILLTEILKASGTSACVDFLNFPNSRGTARGNSRHAADHERTRARGHAPRPGAGDEDLPRDQGYKGLYAIKASGLPGDPIANTQKIIEGVLANM